MFTIGESRAISHANDTEQQAQVPETHREGRRRNPETELFFITAHR